jgi:serine/threonine-protein kinase
MGSLYLAWDPRLERQVAIKVLKEDDEQLRERFSREARSAARLRHPHIVTIFDVGDHDGQPFIAMEFVQGDTLGDVIAQRQPMPLVRKLELIEQLCDGLGFAHRVGIVHRDIKPANVMIDATGSLKILDFGIARALEATSLTQAGMLVGTLNYMSPEQMNGLPVDHRSDIFAVGALFYELLAYNQAFPGAVLGGVINKILNDKPIPLSECGCDAPPEVCRIIDRALEKDPANRYADLGTMRKEILTQRIQLETTSPGMRPAEAATAPAPPTAQRPLATPATPAKATPAPGRRTAEREEIAKRRAGQIQAHL